MGQRENGVNWKKSKWQKGKDSTNNEDLNKTESRQRRCAPNNISVTSNTLGRLSVLTHDARFLSSSVQSITTALHGTTQKKEIEDNLTVKKLSRMIQAGWSKFVSTDNLVDGRHSQFYVLRTKLSLFFLAEDQNHRENIRKTLVKSQPTEPLIRLPQMCQGHQQQESLKNVKSHMAATRDMRSQRAYWDRKKKTRYKN